jgi:hypothetical protein
MKSILVLTSILGLIGVLSGGGGLVIAMRHALITANGDVLTVSHQLLMVAGAILIAISIGFLAVIKQMRMSRE